MRIKLTRTARIKHYPGEIVEVSPEEYNFLINTNSGVGADEIETPEPVEKETTSRKRKKG